MAAISSNHSAAWWTGSVLPLRPGPAARSAGTGRGCWGHGGRGTAGVAVGARRDQASVTAGDIDKAGQFVLDQAHMETGVTQGDWVDTGFHSHVRTLRDRPWSHAGSATNRATAPRSSRGIIPSKSLSEVVVEDRRDEGRGAGDETGVGVRRRGLSRQNQSRSDRQSQFLVFTVARLGRLGDRWRVAGRSRRRTACVTGR